ncbi:Vacuolar membrane protein [[Candida] zeylanoides]
MDRITARDLPKYTAPTTTKKSTKPTSESYTTPAVTVPANHNNPYIIRHHKPNGTVFIAFGTVVGAILLSFVVYHVVKSLRAARIAKRSSATDRVFYEKYNGGGALGTRPTLTPSATTLYNVNTEYSPSVAKLPLLNHQPSASLSGLDDIYAPHLPVGDTSTIYQSEAGNASVHDTTRMFVSPTAEVMTRNRHSMFAAPGDSTASLSLAAPASRERVSNVFIHEGSEGSQVESPPARADPGRKGRGTVPSMYLDDLIDN